MTKLTEEAKARLAKNLVASGGNLSVACRLSRISRETVYRHRREDATFAAWLIRAQKAADEFAVEEIEEKLIKRRFATRLHRMTDRQLIKYLKFLDARAAARAALRRHHG